MQVINHPNDIFKLTLSYKTTGKSIGLVPTMGALHEGHFHLIRQARQINDILVVSIFVNPLQFDREEDFANYPRDLKADLAQLKKLDVDVVFAPAASDMYPTQPEVSIDFGRMAAVMEGEFRPGHFSGVGIVVAKLFNLINPTKAYFGKKDLQQYLLVSRMVKDLSMPVEIIGVPIVREPSGLAMSSRNERLSEAGLIIASKLYSGLIFAKDLWNKGFTPCETKNGLKTFYTEQRGLTIEYLSIVHPDDLHEVHANDSQNAVLCVAGYVENVRLIDNLYLRQD